MPKAYSTDLRARVVCAVEEGMPHDRVAALFQIGIATVVRWLSLWRATGSLAPLKQGGDRRSHGIEAYASLLLDLVKAEPDMTLVEIQARVWEETGKRFSIGVLWRFFDRHAITFKKNATRRRAGKARRCRTPPGLA